MNMELQARKKRKNKKWTMLWKYLLDSWNIHILHFSSVQFSHSVVFDSLWPHARQHARLPCPSPKPGACSNSCPWSQWCHPTISSSVIPFSSCLQSFPASGSFPISWLFASGSQSIGASTSPSVLLMNIQDWFPLGLTGLISLQAKGLCIEPLYHLFSCLNMWHLLPARVQTDRYPRGFFWGCGF